MLRDLLGLLPKESRSTAPIETTLVEGARGETGIKDGDYDEASSTVDGTPMNIGETAQTAAESNAGAPDIVPTDEYEHEKVQSTMAPQETLRQETAELVDILLEACHRTEEDDAEPPTAMLERYLQRTEHIVNTAGISGFMALQEVCARYHDGLGRIVGLGRTLTEPEFLALEMWPMLIMAYLDSPDDPQHAEAFIEQLRSLEWIDPMTGDETEALKNLFELNAENPIAQPTPDTDISTELGAAEWQTEQHAPANEETRPRFSEESSPRHACAADALPAAAQPIDDDGSAPPSLGKAGQELVAILRMEVDQLAESLEECMAIAAEQSTPIAERRQALESHIEDLERLGEATVSVGFDGLAQLSARIRQNLMVMADSDQTLTPDRREVLLDWPDKVRCYLETLFSPETCSALAEYLRDPRWPQPMSADEASALVALLAAPNPEMEEEVEQRPRHARVEDIALDLPEDVNAELLDSLLQELPAQTAELSAATQRLTDRTGSLEDVEVAKRVAHTVKGAANTVGVVGIANLTHHLEDILIACSEKATLPSSALNETLTNAADCLETMSEALLGISAPPSTTESVGALQAVLDWANRIDSHGLPQGEEHPAPRGTLPGLGNTPVQEPSDAGPTAEPTETPLPAAAARQDTASNTTLRVPAKLVDELLRLVGESMILTGQLQDRLRKTTARYDSLRRQHGLMHQLSSDLERIVDIQGFSTPLGHSTPFSDFDPLEMDQYNELHTLSRRLVEAVTDAHEITDATARHLGDLDSLLGNQDRLHGETEEIVMRTRMVPVQTIVARLQRSVRQASRLTEKEVDLRVSGGETLIDSNILNEITDPLMHMLRNSVDHGIERPEERAIMGKEPKGSIQLEFAREGNNIVIRCRDDGAGLKLAEIRYAAQERGLIEPDQKLSDDELGRLILLPGFSTRTETSQVSGRGIGMDAVYSRVLALKGVLNLQSHPNQGCLVELRLPITLMSTRGLLVRERDQVFVVSDRGLEQILYPGVGELGDYGSRAIYQIGEDIFEATELETLLNLDGENEPPDSARRPGLMIRDESGNQRIVLVSEVVDSRDFVVKSLGHYIPKAAGIMGATVLGDGSVTPVLDMPELLRTGASRNNPSGVDARAGNSGAVSSLPHALVVDDSLSARRALGQCLQDAGYEVSMVRDGMEAVTALKELEPDIMLVDMEMPRMNGIELTSHVRHDGRHGNLPVIMITSRSTEKHRQQAHAAGVDIYLTKPFAETELLQHIQEAMSVRGAA